MDENEEAMSGAPSSRHLRAVAIVLCAGQGTRMGAAGNKVFLPLAGVPLVVHALRTFERARMIRDVVLVTHPLEVALCETEIVARHDVRKVRLIVPGGASRHQSETNALDALRDRIQAGEIDIVLIHDGARPFVTAREVRDLLQAAQAHGGALLATPVAPDEVIVRGAIGAPIAEMLDPVRLWRAQTPQAFAARALLAAYDQARADGFEGTDTASSFERLGRQVRVVAGSPTNFKVTTPEDLRRAEYVARHWKG